MHIDSKIRIFIVYILKCNVNYTELQILQSLFAVSSNLQNCHAKKKIFRSWFQEEITKSNYLLNVKTHDLHQCEDKFRYLEIIQEQKISKFVNQ